MDLISSRNFLKAILPLVSRTFALNIRVLNPVEYDFIGCTYLICRFIDTIEDSYSISSQKKVDLLKKFVEIFNPPHSSPEEFTPLINKTIGISHSPPENELISRFIEVIYLFNSLPNTYHEISKDMIIEMALGMADFIDKYSKSTKKILKNGKELELYCYYVAGTVGVILTRMFCLSITTPKNKEVLNKYTNDFSLALQMTNIIKDFNGDKKRGWSYVPKDVLLEANVTVDEFYGDLPPEKVKSIQNILIAKVEVFIKNAITYSVNIPIYLNRYRLFCLIALFLSIRTVFFIKKNNLANIKINKISKFSLYRTIISVYLISPFNSLIKIYYGFLKKDN